MMITHCDLGKQLSEAYQHLIKLPSSYKGSIKVFRSGVGIFITYEIYGMTFKVNRHQSWADMNENRNALIEVIDLLCYKMETFGVLAWDVLNAKTGEHDD